MLYRVLNEFKGTALFYVLSGVAQVLFGAVAVVYFQRLIDGIPASITIDQIVPILVAYGALSLLANITDYLNEYPMRILSNGIYQRLRLLAIEKVSVIDYSAYQNFGTGRLIQVIESGAEAGRKILFGFYLRLARELIPGMAISMAFIGAYDIRVMLAIALGYLVVFIISNLLLRYLYSMKSRMLVHQEDFSRLSVRCFMELVVFRINRRFRTELERLKEKSDEIVLSQARIRMVHELFFAIFSLIVLVVKLLILFFGAKQVMTGTATVGQIVALVTFADRIYTPIAIFNVLFIDYKLDRVALNRLIEFLGQPDDAHLNYGTKCKITGGTIELKGVRYGYHGSDILKHLSLSIPGGSSAALVGTSGAGKSTIIKLILGLLKPVEGQVLIDGQSLADVNLDDYYRHLSYVSQEAPVFDGTLRENIVFDCQVADETLYSILEKVQLGELIARLPKGLDTEVGERGVKLSGGERQRLAFARVFFQQSEVVILDEPTSAMDGITEEQVTQKMLELVRGRTVIIVAHRLRTVAEVDRIFVVQDGSIAEEGTWSDLASKDGLFRQLLTKQSPDGSHGSFTNSGKLESASS